MGRIATFVVLLLSLFYLLIGLNVGLRVYGDGLSLYAAMRILDGDIPYRDFWTLYTPGEFYLLAGLFKVVPPSILAARLLSTLINLALAGMIYLVLRTSVSRTLSLAGLILSVIWIGSLRYCTYPVFPSLLCVFSAEYLLVTDTVRRRGIGLFLAGLLVGMATLFRHDLGFYAWAVGVGALFFFSRSMAPARTIRESLRPPALFSVGVAAAVMPVLCYLLVKVPAHILWQDLVVFPLTVFPEVRALPYPAPGLRTAAFYFPILILVAAVFVAVSRGRSEPEARDPLRFRALVLFTSLAILFLNQARVRSDMAHLVPVLLSSVVPFCLVTDGVIRGLMDRGRSRRPFYTGLTILIMLATVVSVAEPIGLRWRLLRNYMLSEDTHTFRLDRARGVVVPSVSSGYEELVEYIQSSVPEGERIYVGPVRHDRVTICDLMFYFLSNRHSATGYHEIHPGLTTTGEVQRRMAQEIEEAGVRFIVRVDEFHEDSEMSDTETGAGILDLYIGENFCPVRMFRGYTVWKRKT